jgi:AraC-like DNA-binding protein/predicted transcriptional regulator YdeE
MIREITIQNVLNYIDANTDENLSVDKLSEIMYCSVPQLHRIFKHDMDVTPEKYVLKRRLYYAALELVRKNTKIIDIALSYGFNSHDSFSRAFKRVFGVSPRVFRKKAFELNEFYHNLYCVSDYTIPNSLKKECGGNIMCEGEQKQKEFEKFYETYGTDVDIVLVPATKLIGILRPVGGDHFEAFYHDYDKIFRNAPNRKYPDSVNITHAMPKVSSDGKSLLYFVGIEVTSLDEIPNGAVGFELPEQLCAVIGFEGGIDYDTIHYYFDKWTHSQDKYKPDVHKIDCRFPADFAWQTYAPIWEYYSPNKDSEIYEERIYMPIKKVL